MRTGWCKAALWISLAGFLLVAGVVWFALYMPHRNIQREPSVVVTARELTRAYQQDETAANRRFLDKAVEVTGIVGDVETDSEGRTIVVLSGIDPLTAVRCTLLENKKIDRQTTVTLKGKCTGYLSDVILIDCVAIP